MRYIILMLAILLPGCSGPMPSYTVFDDAPLESQQSKRLRMDVDKARDRAFAWFEKNNIELRQFGFVSYTAEFPAQGSPYLSCSFGRSPEVSDRITAEVVHVKLLISEHGPRHTKLSLEVGGRLESVLADGQSVQQPDVVLVPEGASAKARPARMVRPESRRCASSGELERLLFEYVAGR